MLYVLWESAIKLCNDYSSIEPEGKHKTKHGKRLKTLTPKQMLSKLPIALGQLKSGNTSENLLNEIKLYFLWIEQNKLLKKYTI